MAKVNCPYCKIKFKTKFVKPWKGEYHCPKCNKILPSEWFNDLSNNNEKNDFKR